VNFVSQFSKVQERLFLQYIGPRNDFDIIIVGSGIGGGILADALADRLGQQKRILVLEAGSYIYPTHVYNLCRFPNDALARHFGCDTFTQPGNSDSADYIGEKPQLNLGGRSIFWSGLIPTIQNWELAFFPPEVRSALAAGLLNQAGAVMNESRTLGATAAAVVNELRQSGLNADFSIQETPRALHQPYLAADGVPKDQFFTEPTGVFNTAELLINQLGLTPGVSHGDFGGLQLLLNRYVEDIAYSNGRYQALTTNTLDQKRRTFNAPTVVLAAGSIESPKLLGRSSVFGSLPASVQPLVGRGLTDHPTTADMTTLVTRIGNVSIPRTSHAKIIFYSRGAPEPDGSIRYPFDVQMNINHEKWHLRENDPSGPQPDPRPGDSRSQVDIKFSFGNCLDEGNEVRPSPAGNYVPEIRFGNLRWMDRLAAQRFPALAGWHKSPDEVCLVLNAVTHSIFSLFRDGEVPARPQFESWFHPNGKGFGWGTVHHAVGTLRMPFRSQHSSPNFDFTSVVDENLEVAGMPNLYVCDMSVMPFSTAANPVRTLVGLALRLAGRL